MRTQEKIAELTALHDFLLSCFLSCTPGFREFNEALEYLVKIIYSTFVNSLTVCDQSQSRKN